MTELFVFGADPPVPPTCRAPLSPFPAWQTVGVDEAVVDFPALRPARPVGQVLPSLSVATERDLAFRFAARVEPTGPWIPASPVGNDPPRSEGFAGVHCGPLRADVDVFLADPSVTQVQIRLWLRSNDLDAVLRAPTLAAISLFDGAVEPGSAAGVATALAVPPLSQMTAPEAIRSRICSPTCVSMVLGYWGHVIEPAALASEMYDGRHDVYGVWPAAIAAAARRRVHGYLLRFPSWAAVEWCLSRRLPVIASIRYTARELRGAAVEATAGHLIVLTGFDGEGVLVNDPAAPTPDEVPRSYSRSDLHRVWLERTGVGYVLFPASSRQPT